MHTYDMPTTITKNLLSWAVDADGATLSQAHRAARLPIIEGHVALMPDAHIGIGATIGSVIPTTGAIIPSAVGVDLGCGMAAISTNLTANDLPDSLDGLLGPIERAVPAGVGQGHDRSTRAADRWFDANPYPGTLAPKMARSAHQQFGSLGSGNHFFEVCLDETSRVWLFLHSGSRGVGNQLAQRHIAYAKRLRHSLDHVLDDPDLAWFVQGTAEFDAYITDMNWAQAYAFGNREAMLNAAFDTFGSFIGGRSRSAGAPIRETGRINCHHNYAAQEMHNDRKIWVTRKGAISARDGELGLIPGSMGTRSYVVRGRGNPLSWNSCSHGAGRRMSRTAAKNQFTSKDLVEQMGDRAWLRDRASQLIDEIPSAYKDIDEVMAAQSDLVNIVHTLTQVLNYKGC
jgi:tRNA-splicing ligase RtcB (3'-phosphate/5'-hydroxy nucleic acid ligase)